MQKELPAYALLLSLGAIVLLLVRLGGTFRSVLEGVALLGQQTDKQAFQCLLRSTGILLLADYTRTLCKESGAEALGWCGRASGRVSGAGGSVPTAGRSVSTDLGAGRMSGKKYRGLLAGLVFLAAMPFGTVRAFALESLPGRELWQPYLTQSAQGAADFARDPVSALLSLLPGSPVQLLVDTLHSYADLLLFLLLLTALSFLVGDAADGTLLDLAAAGGCGVLIWVIC